MSFFTHTPKNAYHTLIVDIGSGSVGLAIVRSIKSEAQPAILWTYREYSLIKDVALVSVSLREINTTLVNAFLKLGSDGLRALKDATNTSRLDSIQVAVCAPWTYTITKTVHYTEENPFTITRSLIEELSDIASKKAMESVVSQSLLANSGLATIDNQVVGVLANDYALQSYENIETKDVTLMHLTAVTHQRILETLDEVTGKVLPRTTNIATHSFMYIFFDVLRGMYPATAECALIDVTNEATEVGIVRDNILQHTSHAPYGAYTLVREIAAMADIPKEEAYAYIRGGAALIEGKLRASKQQALQSIFEAYEDKIALLFKQTGDTLTIPKTLYLHTDSDTEAFFIAHIKSAAKKATGIEHSVHPITSAILAGTKSNNDTAILLSASYFHRHTH